MEEENIRDDTWEDTLRGWSVHRAISLLSTVGMSTSPAADANPERHLATRSSSKVLTCAVHTRSANNNAIERIRTGRLPSFTDSGTQTMLPMPRRRKLNYNTPSVSRPKRTRPVIMAYCQEGIDSLGRFVKLILKNGRCGREPSSGKIGNEVE